MLVYANHLSFQGAGAEAAIFKRNSRVPCQGLP